MRPVSPVPGLAATAPVALVAVASLVALVALVALASGAAAHADLLTATPQPNTRLEAAPTEIVLSFSERVESGNLCGARSTCVEMVGPDGTDHVAAIEVDAGGLRVTAHLEAVEDGLYTVRWRALSSVDGHTTSGAFLLGARTDIPEGDLPPDSDPVRDVRVLETIVRAFAYAGASLAAGIPLFLLWTRRLGSPPRAVLLLRLAAAGSALAALGAVLLLAGLGSTPWEAFRTTDYGRRVGWRALLFAASGAAAWWAAPRPHEALRCALALAAASTALLVTSLASHAAAVPSQTALAIGADFVHQLAAAAWIGGLACLAPVLARAADPVAAGRFVRRFSPFAMLAVVTLVATGVYGALLHVDDPLSPELRPYTLALLAKISLLLPLLLLGAWNRYGLQPRLLATPGGATMGRLRASVGIEVVLLALVLVATGALTHASPPWGSDPDAPPAGPIPGEVLAWSTLDGHEFRVSVLPIPVTVGVQNVTLHLYPGPEGVPENAAAFLTTWDPQGAENGPLRLKRIDETRWSLHDVLFTEAGGWHVELLFQGRGVTETRDFHIDVEA